jgi:hypothetical protein
MVRGKHLSEPPGSRNLPRKSWKESGLAKLSADQASYLYHGKVTMIKLALLSKFTA